MDKWTLHATPGAACELLSGGGEFQPADVLLADLTDEQSRRKPMGSPYSIGQIVSHMQFWQARQISAHQGATAPRPESLAETFEEPAPGEWPALVSAFLGGIIRCIELAEELRTATSPTRGDASAVFDLAESALHNAYHLGQIALLRQSLGMWPPPGCAQVEM